MTPTTAEAWIAAATERAADAEAMLPSRGTSAGPIYMAGYAIECSPKAFLQCQGIRFPAAGQSGHDLKALWHRAGFRRGDLGDQQGERAFYVES
jgi:hypothetical protein